MKQLLAAVLLFSVSYSAEAARVLGNDGGSVPQVSRDGAVTTLILQNVSSSIQNSGWVSFAHVFKPGDVQPADQLVGQIGTTNFYMQRDCKTIHTDGSCRHAVLTMNAPRILAGQSASVTITHGSASSPTQRAPTAPQLLANGYDITVV